MRIGFVVNVMDSGEAGATTYRMAAECLNRGHEAWILSTGNLSYNPDETIGGRARTVPAGEYTSESFLKTLKSRRAKQDWLVFDDLDVLFLRSNPAAQNPWAQFAGVQFGRLAMRRGVVVLNDPNGLSKAANKLYLQTFPESVRPRTLVTRSRARIEAFLEEQGVLVVKPLLGSGGDGVFIIRHDDRHNLDEIVSAVTRDGYVIAQEYLPAAVAGDTRLFLMNGRPLVHQGKHAAFRRIRTGDDLRSNIHAGGKLRRAEVDDEMLRIAEMVRPRLVEDGMFLVGLDIAGDKLMEINVFSPGGLGSAQVFEKVDFAQAVVEALERKADARRSDPGRFSNIELATL